MVSNPDSYEHFKFKYFLHRTLHVISLLLPNAFRICELITVTFDWGIQGLQTYKILPCAIQNIWIVVVISDLLLIFSLETYTILVSDSSKSENIMSQDSSVLHSQKRNEMHFWIGNYDIYHSN